MLRLDLAVGAVGGYKVLYACLRNAQRQLFAGESAHREEDNEQQECGERPQYERFCSTV
jgi:hypothetical protein